MIATNNFFVDGYFFVERRRHGREMMLNFSLFLSFHLLMTFGKSFQISSFKKVQQASGFPSKFPFSWLRWKEKPTISPSISSDSTRDGSPDSEEASPSSTQSSNEFYDGTPMDLPQLSYEDCYYTVLDVSPDVDVTGLQKSYLRLVTTYHPYPSFANNSNRTVTLTPSKHRTALQSSRSSSFSSETDEDSNLSLPSEVVSHAYSVLRNDQTRSEYNQKRLQGLYGIKSGIYSIKYINPSSPVSSLTSPAPVTSASAQQSTSVKSSRSHRSAIRSYFLESIHNASHLHSTPEEAVTVESLIQKEGILWEELYRKFHFLKRPETGGYDDINVRHRLFVVFPSLCLASFFFHHRWLIERNS
jgi:curved DNA-binding protein CbpA